MDALVKCITPNAAKTIKACAKAKKDHKMIGMIAVKALLAGEAYYHSSCRLAYTRRAVRTRLNSSAIRDSSVIGGIEHRKASDNAFEHVYRYIIGTLPSTS